MEDDTDHPEDEITCSSRDNFVINECPYCDFNSQYKKNLTRHLKRAHPRERFYKCSHCQFTTPFECEMNIHSSKHKVWAIKIYRCRHCEFAATRRKALRAHMAKHTKPYMCGECGYRAAYKSNMASHMKIHIGEKPYRCTRCCYATAESAKLSRHMRLKLHRPEDPQEGVYKCPCCDFMSSTLSVMIVHFATPNTDHFLCKICSHVMANKGDYEVHMHSHIGNQYFPYQNGKCNTFWKRRRMYCTPTKLDVRTPVKPHISPPTYSDFYWSKKLLNCCLDSLRRPTYWLCYKDQHGDFLATSERLDRLPLSQPPVSPEHFLNDKNSENPLEDKDFGNDHSTKENNNNHCYPVLCTLLTTEVK
ncbi:zinc finger protein 578-like [Branchiostoma floridae]|uniref:Zinc finger protein 578-like n=1 Tax=Branchiostoma floridae TaxID=7739 RepID=A0A9J7HRK9_BRAFL|nr:zinc finger protein 578-like [Branchiostoma floridae]